jgi:hypothetical protein
MDESFSRTGFLYGMAFVLAISRACTLMIWRTLPKPRPPLRQELIEAWRRRRTRRRVGTKAASALQDQQYVADDGAADGGRTESTVRLILPAPAERPNETTTPNAGPKPL